MTVRYIMDSSGDVKHIKGVDFRCVPLTISTAEKDFVDDEELNVSDMLTYMEEYKGRSFTACPSAVSWLDALDGASEAYVLTLSSGVSGTYNSAKAAADMYASEHPGCQICVIDTLTTGAEMRLILEKVIEMKNKGFSFEEVCEKIKYYILETRVFFAFRSLHNLAQNGRVNKLAASALGVLGISIIGTGSEEGKIEQIGKCRGEKAVLKDLLKEMEKAGYHGGKVRITHAENEKLARRLAISIKEKYEQADIIVTPMRGICCFYAERGGIIIGCECNNQV